MQTNKRIPVSKITIVMDCENAGTLAEFYSKLLGWKWTHPHVNGWAAITSPTGFVIAFQDVDGYESPVWPWEKGKQGQMVHLDFWVDDLEESVQHALTCGARLAGEQFFKTSRTLLDPAGHPFCLDTAGEE